MHENYYLPPLDLLDKPGESNSLVSFREVLVTLPKEKYEDRLTVVLGKNEVGNSVFFDLDKCSPLLISGTTGSGKSVCINTIICSLLMRNKPDSLKLLLIDTKRLELPFYNGIPHLITPVITNSGKASIELQKVVRKMEKRYDLLSGKFKNIEAYNEYCKKNNAPLLPYLVVVIDDMTDLVKSDKLAIEDSLTRLAKYAKSTGIFLILSAQRPSSEFFDGELKVNILSRISFVTSSVIDSKNILNMSGAEKLRGKGDMLFLPVGENTPLRVQGAYVSEEEISKIVDFCSSQQKAIYDEPSISELYISVKNDVTEDDPIYNEALEFVLSTGKASASILQRKFKLGYNRAARLIDLFEERGIIGPQQGSKPREVLYKVEEK